MVLHYKARVPFRDTGSANGADLSAKRACKVGYSEGMPDLTPPTSISAVTVFSDRARITRAGEAVLTQGQSVVEVKDIPLSLQPDSVRVKGRGAGVKILGIDVATAYLPSSPDAGAAELQREIETLEAEIRKNTEASAIQQDRLKTLSAVRANSAAEIVKGIAKGKSSVEALDGILAYADRQEDECRKAIQSLGETIRDLNRQLDAAKARRHQIHQAAASNRKVIRIAVEAANPGETAFSFELTYVCNGAHWQPLYDMRLDDGRGKVQASYLAMVSQNTGEDWNGVELSLSTARTAATQSIPKLEPWYLRLYVEPPAPPMMAKMSMARGRALGGAEDDEAAMPMLAAAAPASAAAPPPPPAEVAQAEVSEQRASAVFKVPRAMSIPSGNTPHRTQIAEFELPAHVDYVAAPKLALQAYIRATVTNDSPLVLLPGKANLFHGDDFVGTSHLAPSAGRDFELQMGVDERIGIQRELVSRDVSKAFLGGTRKIGYRFRIELENRLPASAALTVFDQIPHSRHEEIKVKLVDATPKPNEVTELGELKWNITLESGRRQELFFEFSVEYPKTQELVGIGI